MIGNTNNNGVAFRTGGCLWSGQDLELRTWGVDGGCGVVKDVFLLVWEELGMKSFPIASLDLLLRCPPLSTATAQLMLV